MLSGVNISDFIKISSPIHVRTIRQYGTCILIHTMCLRQQETYSHTPITKEFRMLPYTHIFIYQYILLSSRDISSIIDKKQHISHSLTHANIAKRFLVSCCTGFIIAITLQIKAIWDPAELFKRFAHSAGPTLKPRTRDQ